MTQMPEKGYRFDFRDGIGVELWDDDGPMTTRIMLPLLKAKGTVDAVCFYPGPHRPGQILRPGRATASMYFADYETGEPSIRIDAVKQAKLHQGTFHIGDGPLFRNVWSDMHGQGVHR